jgi:hypothetical protein
LNPEEVEELAKRIDGDKFCRQIVDHWEGVDERAAAFVRQWNLDANTQQLLADQMREIIGGVEVYEAAREFLKNK